MNIWYFINYKVFEFYKKTSDSSPEVMSAIVSTIFIQANIFVFTGIIYNLYRINILGHVITMIVIYFALLLFSYFTIYKDKNYLEIFQKMQEWERKNRKPIIIFRIYFYLSILSFVGTAIWSISFR